MLSYYIVIIGSISLIAYSYPAVDLYRDDDSVVLHGCKIQNGTPLYDNLLYLSDNEYNITLPCEDSANVSDLALVRYDPYVRDFVYYMINGRVLKPYIDTIVFNNISITILNYTRYGLYDNGPYACIALSKYNYKNPIDCRYVLHIDDLRHSMYSQYQRKQITISCNKFKRNAIWLLLDDNDTVTILQYAINTETLTVSQLGYYICITQEYNTVLHMYITSIPGEDTIWV